MRSLAMTAAGQGNGKERALPGRSVCARYPDRWPAEMRADVAAALFDFETTWEFFKAIRRGEAPPPSAYRTRGSRREPVWALEVCHSHIARRHQLNNNASPDSEDIRSLV
jgi:hypothetical protein